LHLSYEFLGSFDGDGRPFRHWDVKEDGVALRSAKLIGFPSGFACRRRPRCGGRTPRRGKTLRVSNADVLKPQPEETLLQCIDESEVHLGKLLARLSTIRRRETGRGGVKDTG